MDDETSGSASGGHRASLNFGTIFFQAGAATSGHEFKVPFFTSLGYTALLTVSVSNKISLRSRVRGDAEPGRKSPYGRRVPNFVVLPMGRLRSSASVLTVWIHAEFETDIPEFVTAYPGETLR